MTVIYRSTDRIPVKIKGLELKLSPLSYSQKAELHSHIAVGTASGDTGEILTASRKAVKYCVKEVSGLTDMEGNEYKLSFENGILTDDCVDELLNAEFNQELIGICAAMSNGVPEEFLDSTGKPMKGVSRVKKPKRGKKSPN